MVARSRHRQPNRDMAEKQLKSNENSRKCECEIPLVFLQIRLISK